MRDNNVLTVLQLRHRCVISYKEYLTGIGPLKDNSIPIQHISNLKYTGHLTKYSRKNLSKALELLYLSSNYRKVYSYVLSEYINFRLSHLTVTLSGTNPLWNYKDYTANLLSPFLSDCRRKFGLTKYVWKAELQENGNIHYHIVSDMYRNHTDVRNLWNYHQKKHGLLTDYYNRFHNWHPNSTDIHTVDCSGNIINYLLKYISKSTQNQTKINGKVWDCSLNLKGKQYFILKTDDAGFNDMRILTNFLYYDAILKDRFIIYKPLQGNVIDNLPANVRKLYRDYYSALNV